MIARFRKALMTRPTPPGRTVRTAGERVRLLVEELEARDVPSAPGVLGTTPTPLLAGGQVPSWTATVGTTTSVNAVIRVGYDPARAPTAASAGNIANYLLTNVTTGTAFSTTGAAVGITSVTFSTTSQTATLSLSAPLAVGPDTYRLTVLDNVVSVASGLKLDGDNDGAAGGNFVRTFVVAPRTFSLTGFPAATTAGQAGAFTVQALDAGGNVAAGYRGTVRLTSSDSKAVLPADYAFTATDAGSRTFTGTLISAGTGRSITVNDAATTTITGRQSAIAVSPAAAAVFTLSVPTNTTAGVAFGLTVTAKDVFGNVVTGYIGAVRFTSTDTQAGLPVDYTFVAADAGVKTFSVTLKTAGSRSVVVTDTAGGWSKSASTSVAAAAATRLAVVVPATVTVGSRFTATVTARDAFGNTAGGYVGTVKFATDDALAGLPADYTFTAADAGRRAFSVTFNNFGSHDLTVTDAAASFLTTVPVATSPVRYAVTSNTIYVNGPVVVTLSDLRAVVPASALVLVDAAVGVWFLRANLVLQRGAALRLSGTAVGGDVNELRLMSNNVAGATNNTVKISADWGSITIDTVRVKSWDEAVDDVDTEYATYGRSFIQVRSSLDADGVTARESRMDVRSSDIGYLGSDASEAYGLSWKVIGDPGAAITDAFGNPTYELFEKVNVLGDITNSRLHHNYFGMFSYGAYGMRIVGNESDHNVGYGLDPHDDSDDLLIEGNHVHHNGFDGIIVSKRCDRVVFRNNVSEYNAQNGLFFHVESNDGLMEGNVARYNGLVGIIVYASVRATVRDNTSTGNEFGLKLFGGSSDNTIVGNDIGNSVQYGINLTTGVDPRLYGDGRQRNNTFRNNTVHDSGSYAVRAVDSDDTLFQGNTFTGNDATLSFENSRRSRLDGNNFQAGQVVAVDTTNAFPASVSIVNQPDVRVSSDAGSTVVFDDAGGKVFDVEGGAFATTVSGPTLSALSLPGAALSGLGTVEVFTRDLSARTDAGATVRVTPTAWETTGVRRKAWTAKASAVGQVTTFAVGDLLPNTDYVVLKNNALLARVTTDGAGRVSIADAASSTVTASYSVATDAASLSLGTLTQVTAGQTQAVTVRILDAFGNAATGYTGTVRFSSTDPLASLPADYTFAAADAGTKTFSVTFKTAGTQTVTAADIGFPTLTATQTGSVTAAAAKRFVVAGTAGPVTAGTARAFTVTAQDVYGNVATGYRGTVRFTSSDTQARLPADYTFAAADAGVRAFAATLRTAGARTVTATDAADGSVLGKEQGISVVPAAATGFVVGGFPDPVAAGTPGGFTVTAKDAFGNVATGYTGTVRFTSTDALATLPADYAFTAADAGTRSFALTLRTVGSRAVAATDTTQATVTGQQSAITVTSATANTFGLDGFPTSPAAGDTYSVVLTVKDAFGNVATGYRGTVRFSSTDPLAVLPADYAFTAADAGNITVSLTFKTAGSQTVTFGDGTASSQATAQVVPGAVKTFAVTGTAFPASAGVAQTITVTALDTYGNVATGYRGTVRFSSTDPLAVLPADYAFTAADQGSYTFTATLRSAGLRTVTATDVADGTVLGKQQNITVVAAAATGFVVGGFADPVAAGTPGSFTVSAKDAFGNVATGYTGTVRFSSTDPLAVLPADYAFTAADAGVRAFAATLFTSGSQAITATDAAGSLTGRQSAITVQALAYASVVVRNYPATTAGESRNVEVRVLDAFGNLATGYTGTVRFSSTDPLAVLPADYTFTSQDGGNKVFAVTLKTAGTQSLAVSDSTLGLTGTQTGIAVTAAAVKRFNVTGLEAGVTAGTAGAVTVTATDAYGNATGYLGTVRFTSTDPAAVLPADYTFTAADAGRRTFAATLFSAGLRTVTATDVADGTVLGKQQNVLVRGAAAAYFAVTTPASVTTGIPFDFTVSAKDRYGNFTTDYLGTVTFSSNDLAAVVPTDYTFTATDQGTRTFVGGATLLVQGIHHVAATDATTATITGKSSSLANASPALWVAATNTIYISGITVTLSDIDALLPTAPLTLVDAVNHVWKLDAKLMLLNGATLNLYGTEVGGDVDELRLKSNNVRLADGSEAPDNTIWIKAAYGNIDIRYTTITSWDDALNAPDANPGIVPPRDGDEGADNGGADHQRSYLAVRSFFDVDGDTPLRSRMDIDHSDIGYLGSHTTQGYGLSWKAEGYGAEIHSRLHVYGSVTNSRVHHNFFGIYTYGGYDMDFINNEVDNNVWYGIDPHDDTSHSRFVGNYAHSNGTHGIILSVRCNYNVIANNVSVNNGLHGIMLHRSSNHNQVYGNTVDGNGQVGIAIFESFDNVITGNTITNNYKGVRFSMGSDENVLDGNEIAFNEYAGVDFLAGGDPPNAAVNADNRADHNTVSNNRFHDNGLFAIRVTLADDNAITGNTFTNESSIQFVEATGNLLSGNVLPAGLVVSNKGSAATATTTIVRDQPSTNVQVDARSTVVFGDAAGTVFETGALGLSTLVQPLSGSQLRVSRANAPAGSATVRAVGLRADTATGAGRIFLTPGSWAAGDAAPRAWSVQQNTPTDQVHYTISGLTAGTFYTVDRGGVRLATLAADAAGTIQFRDSAGDTSPTQYQVTKSLAPNYPPATAANVKYSASSATVTVTGAVTVTPTLLKSLLPAGVIDLVSAAGKVWYLKANLVLKGGAAFVVLGEAAGGDANELRLRSNNTTGPGSFVSVKADWGVIVLDGVKVTSWDEAANGPDLLPATNNRAFIQVASSLDADGVTARESVMNINNSDIGYLGYGDSIPGVYWTVKTTNPAVLARVRVFGTVTNSKFHHNFYGAGIKWASGGITFTNNEVFANVRNGIVLKSYATGQTIVGNIIRNNGGSGVLASGYVTGLTLRNNSVVRNATYGVTLQTGSNGATIEGNTITDNLNAGVYLSGSDSSSFRNNVLLRNQYGVRLEKSSGMNLFVGNEVAGSVKAGVQVGGGSGSGVNADGTTRGNTFDGNNLRDNAPKAVVVDTSDNTVFRNNTITGAAAQTVSVARSLGTTFSGNTVGDNVSFVLTGSSTLATLVTVTDQPKLTVKVDSYSSVRLASTSRSVFKVGASTTLTTVSPAGSSLTVGAAVLGTSASVLVTTRQLGATPDVGSATVDSAGWNSTPTAAKSLVVRAGSPTQMLAFRFGNLTPGGSYVVKKNGLVVIILVGGTDGSASLTDLVGTTAAVTYTLTPT